VNGERPLVVIADDEEDILTLVETVLSHAGFEVVKTRDGAQALAEIRARRPQLAVLDLSMPELDGLEVLRHVRADAELAALPVVLLTARAQETDVARGYAEGASKYVRKPFRPSELAEVAKGLVQPPADGR
jgi:two-component system response regulator MtrA